MCVPCWRTHLASLNALRVCQLHLTRCLSATLGEEMLKRFHTSALDVSEKVLLSPKLDRHEQNQVMSTQMVDSTHLQEPGDDDMAYIEPTYLQACIGQPDRYVSPADGPRPLPEVSGTHLHTLGTSRIIFGLKIFDWKRTTKICYYSTQASSTHLFHELWHACDADMIHQSSTTSAPNTSQIMQT